MRNRDNFTPKEAAADIAASWLAAVYSGKTGDVWAASTTAAGNPSARFAKELLKHLQKIRADLLEKADLDDGVFLKEPDEAARKIMG